MSMGIVTTIQYEKKMGSERGKKQAGDRKQNEKQPAEDTTTSTRKNAAQSGRRFGRAGFKQIKSSRLRL